MMVLGDSSLVEKKFFGRPRGERSIRIWGTGSGSGLVCAFPETNSREAIATTLAVTADFRRDPTIGFFRSTLCLLVALYLRAEVVNSVNG